MIFRHNGKRIADGLATLNGHRVVNHSVFRTLDDGHLPCLVLNTHILMDYADTAFTCNGYSHLGFSHGIHSCRDKRYFQVDIARELGIEGYGAGQYL